jgi:hypothetical protein
MCRESVQEKAVPAGLGRTRRPQLVDANHDARRIDSARDPRPPNPPVAHRVGRNPEQVLASRPASRLSKFRSEESDSAVEGKLECSALAVGLGDALENQHGPNKQQPDEPAQHQRGEHFHEGETRTPIQWHRRNAWILSTRWPIGVAYRSARSRRAPPSSGFTAQSTTSPAGPFRLPAANTAQDC